MWDSHNSLEEVEVSSYDRAEELWYFLQLFPHCKIKPFHNNTLEKEKHSEYNKNDQYFKWTGGWGTVSCYFRGVCCKHCSEHIIRALLTGCYHERSDVRMLVWLQAGDLLELSKHNGQSTRGRFGPLKYSCNSYLSL